MRLLLCLLALVLTAPLTAHAAERVYAAPMAKPVAAPPSTRAERVLEAADVQRYREIFRLQAKGKWRAADTHIKALDNKLLLGHVLHQRYMHPTDYRSRYSELRGWLKKYADHPGAKRLYRLAVKRRGKARYPKRPIPASRKRSAKSDV
ncbi:MAG: hypothetical protein AAGA36_06520, partial [Pseudomonadota bacterium]